jgi:hypothetical protein
VDKIFAVVGGMRNPPPNEARGFSDYVAVAATVEGLAVGAGRESNKPSRILFVFWFPGCQ